MDNRNTGWRALGCRLRLHTSLARVTLAMEMLASPLRPSSYMYLIVLPGW